MTTEEWDYKCKVCAEYGINPHDQFAGVLVVLAMCIKGLENINNQTVVN